MNIKYENPDRNRKKPESGPGSEPEPAITGPVFGSIVKDFTVFG